MKNGTARRIQEPRGLEYRLYFFLVLLISVPTALLRSILPGRKTRRRFFLAEALDMARSFTPQIFAA